MANGSTKNRSVCGGDARSAQPIPVLAPRDDESPDSQGSPDSKEESGKKKKGGGSCSGGAEGTGAGDHAACCPCPTKECPTPKLTLQVDTNDVPENWWDQLPDFDPRVYDAISMEQAAACVNYITQGLPDMNDAERQLEARKFRKICPKLKVQVPRTKVIKPREITYDTKVSAFVQESHSQTY